MSRNANKTVAFKSPVKPKPIDNADAWVSDRVSADVSETPIAAIVALAAAPSDTMKRFTIDVSESLHKRIKAQCAMRGAKMADVIRDLLEKEFPKQ